MADIQKYLRFQFVNFLLKLITKFLSFLEFTQKVFSEDFSQQLHMKSYLLTMSFGWEIHTQFSGSHIKKLLCFFKQFSYGTYQ